MVQSYNLPKCPHCLGAQVEPVGPRLWHCFGCGKDFPEAVVEQEPEKPKDKKKGDK